MHAATTITATISEPLTWEEICKRYPDEWVCLVELDRIDVRAYAFRTARVVGHGKCRREAVEQARPWWPHHVEIEQTFTGKVDTVPDDSLCLVEPDLPQAGMQPPEAHKDPRTMLASNPSAMISEPLTWQEICERFPDEWVCLVEIDRPVPQNFEFRTARVVGHGKTRREPFEQARPWWEYYDAIGHYYTGPRIAPFPRVIP